MSEETSHLIDPDTSYEKARDELTGLVRALETGGLNLDQTIQLWERSEALVHYCQEKLDGATARIEAVLANRDNHEEDDEEEFEELEDNELEEDSEDD